MAANLGSTTKVDLAKERRIVILGKTGSGKSASGNNILGKDVFETSALGSSVTKKCQRGTAHRFGCKIEVIDTPGLFDTDMTESEVQKEICKCFGMAAPGPHAFVLVVRIGRFTKEEQNTVQQFKQVFGEKMVDYLLVLFTGQDNLQADNKTLAEYVQSAPKILTDLLKACHHRCIAFNNRASESELEKVVKEFFEKIDDILRDNGDNCYTNEMFEEAEKVIKEREKQLEKENEQKRRNQLDALKKESDEKLISQSNTYKFEVTKLQNKIREIERASKQSSAEASKFHAQKIAKLKSDLKNLAKKNDMMKKDLEKEQKRKEKEAEDEAKDDVRETVREEVNKEKSGVMGLLLTSVLGLGLLVSFFVAK